MFISLKDAKQLSGEDLTAELAAKENEGEEGKPNILGIICHEISDEAARSIAAIYGKQDQPGRSYLWMLANGDRVGPEYVHDDIDQIIDELDLDDPDARVLQFLKGWLFLQVRNAPRDDVGRVPEPFRVKLSSISVRDLVGRYIANRNGHEFLITDVRYEIEWGKVSFVLADLDADGDVIPGSESGIFALEGWTVL